MTHYTGHEKLRQNCLAMINVMFYGEAGLVKDLHWIWLAVDIIDAMVLLQEPKAWILRTRGASSARRMRGLLSYIQGSSQIVQRVRLGMQSTKQAAVCGHVCS